MVKRKSTKKGISTPRPKVPIEASTPKRTTATGKTANLRDAKAQKNDEFYTQWVDIEREMNAYLEFDPNLFRDKVILLPCDDPEWSNFAKFFALHFMDYGIKKLIATSYAANSKPLEIPYQPTLFESEAPHFDATKTRTNGKLYVLEAKDVNQDGVVNIEDLQWEYLESDGDFRSVEVTLLRNEADIIITNPPFSLFREFLAWILEGNKKFVILGNMNAITYKEIFRLIKTDSIWLGQSIHAGDREFEVPPAIDTRSKSLRVDEFGKRFIRVDGIRWFTNIDHGRRHEPLRLMTMADNLKHSKRKVVRDFGYRKYDNYDAIEVPFTEAIPSDYPGIMGVPISFLSKYNPDQFKIFGMAASAGYNAEIVGIPFLGEKDGRPIVNGINTYARIFIGKKVDA